MAHSTSNEDFFYAWEAMNNCKEGDRIILKCSKSQHNPLQITQIENPEYGYEDFESPEEVEAYLAELSHLVEIELSISHLNHEYGPPAPSTHVLFFVHNKKTNETKPIGPHNQFDSSEYNTEFHAVEDFFTEDQLKEKRAWNQLGDEASKDLARLVENTDDQSLIEIMSCPLFLGEACEHLTFTFQNKLDDGSLIFECKDLFNESNSRVYKERFEEIEKTLYNITEKLEEISKRLN